MSWIARWDAVTVCVCEQGINGVEVISTYRRGCTCSATVSGPREVLVQVGTQQGSGFGACVVFTLAPVDYACDVCHAPCELVSTLRRYA